MRHLSLAVLAGAALAIGPAHAMSAEPYQKQRGFVLTAGTHYLLLNCDGSSTEHPQAVQACAALTTVGGDPALLPRAEVFCTMQHDPVSVSATGVWDGDLVRFEKTYGNACEMRAATGPVFAF